MRPNCLRFDALTIPRMNSGTRNPNLRHSQTVINQLLIDSEEHCDKGFASLYDLHPHLYGNCKSETKVFRSLKNKLHYLRTLKESNPSQYWKQYSNAKTSIGNKEASKGVTDSSSSEESSDEEETSDEETSDDDDEEEGQETAFVTPVQSRYYTKRNSSFKQPAMSSVSSLGGSSGSPFAPSRPDGGFTSLSEARDFGKYHWTVGLCLL